MITSRQELEALLTSVQGFQNPRVELEQYMTPPRVAATILWVAHTNFDIYQKTVIDLGSGTGILAIGAGLLEAKRVIGVELDPESVAIAESNLKQFSLEQVVFINEDMFEIKNLNGDTVIMNPPFGVQSTKKDKEYLSKAFELAPNVYSLFNYHPGNVKFLERFSEKKGFQARVEGIIDYEIPRTFTFHKKNKKVIKAVLIKFWEN